MRSSSVLSICAGLALCLMAAPVEAQLVEVSQKRFEITPVFGYQWGGAFSTNSGGALGAGELRLTDSFAWGAIISFLAQAGSAVELIYHRQDTDVEFDPAGAGSNTNLGGFAVNYIQIGGRQQFGRRRGRKRISGVMSGRKKCVVNYCRIVDRQAKSPITSESPCINVQKSP